MPSPMPVTVLFFGSLSDVAGTDRLELPSPGDLHALQSGLEARFPALQQTPYRITVNLEFTHGNTGLAPGDEVALLPPYAGG